MATNLTEYGIQTDESDYHLHVCPIVRRLYIFPTSAGLEAIRLNNIRPRPAGQMVNGRWEITAQGYPMPIRLILPIRECVVPDEFWQYYPIEEGMSLLVKGRQAHMLAQRALYEGQIPLFFDPEDVTDIPRQIGGKDLHIHVDKTIQIKCDYTGGNRALGGTGNLFLQTHERNPNKAR